MDKNHGYVKIYRDITDWGWYKDANTARVFIHCIIKANFEDREWMGRKIPRGSFVTSIKNLAKELKLTKKQVYTAINHLKQTHELEYLGTSRYSVITVKKYASFQNKGTVKGTQWEHKWNTDGTLRETTKEYKERKKGRREEELHRIFEELREELKS